MTARYSVSPATSVQEFWKALNFIIGSALRSLRPTQLMRTFERSLCPDPTIETRAALGSTAGIFPCVKHSIPVSWCPVQGSFNRKSSADLSLGGRFQRIGLENEAHASYYYHWTKSDSPQSIWRGAGDGLIKGILNYILSHLRHPGGYRLFPVLPRPLFPTSS